MNPESLAAQFHFSRVRSLWYEHGIMDGALFFNVDEFDFSMKAYTLVFKYSFVKSRFSRLQGKYETLQMFLLTPIYTYRSPVAGDNDNIFHF
eukprot:IDg9291t1